MPQDTQELFERWDGPEETKAIEHLEARGYVLTRDFRWVVPEGLSPSEDDLSAISFLIQEWDYGGIAGSYK